MPNYEVRELQKQLKVYADGRYVAAVQQGKFRPYVYPLFTPAGYGVLQIAPADHLHHLGIWVAHDDVNGLNFWAPETRFESPPPQILVRSTETSISDAGVRFDQAIEWVAPDGTTVVLGERRTTTVVASAAANTVDVVTTLKAPGHEVQFGQTKEAGVAVRVADQIDVLDGGRIVNAEGLENEPATFDQVSAWVDYSGPVTPDATAGVAVFPYPNAAGIPWFTRDYGPMYVSRWRQAPMTLAAGETYTIGVRFAAHDESCEEANVPGLFDAFQREVQT